MDGSVDLGRWRARTIDGGQLHLDGGAMFGSVPRVVWQRCIAPDSRHRIPLATRLLLLEDSESQRIVVIDAGVGDKEDAGFRERFDIRLPAGSDEAPLRRTIRAAGVDPEQVTDLILTHLHFDHVGGATRLDAAGDSTAVLPAARHWVQDVNWLNGLSPGVREKASYLRSNIEPLEGASAPAASAKARRTGAVAMAWSTKVSRSAWTPLARTSSSRNPPRVVPKRGSRPGDSPKGAMEGGPGRVRSRPEAAPPVGPRASRLNRQPGADGRLPCRARPARC